jgi:hypothetical protein
MADTIIYIYQEMQRRNAVFIPVKAGIFAENLRKVSKFSSERLRRL